MLKRLRIFFITGLVVLAPIVVTVYVFWQVFFKIDSLLSGYLSRWPMFTIYGRTIPGMGLVAVILAVLLVGMLASNIIGRKLIGLGDKIVTSIPLIGRIYIAVQQISKAFLAEERAALKKAVLIEYPRKGVYSIGFLTSEAQGEVQDNTEEDVYSVFLPTTPNPTSGFLLLIPKEEITPLDMTIEDALKLIISGGMVTPTKVLTKEKEARKVGGSDEVKG